jgi:putative holliday junction resolvase
MSGPASRSAGVGQAQDQPQDQSQERAAGRVVGVDLGRRRVGLAVSDSDRRVASALTVLARRATHYEDHAELAGVVAETGANLVVVGLPLSLSGRPGPAAKEVEEEVAELQRALPVPVELCDERYSTVVADRSLRAGGRKAPARREIVDKVAAAGILQTWLDRQRNTPPAMANPLAGPNRT